MAIGRGYQPGINILWMRLQIWLQTSTVFWLGGGTISLSYLMYMGLMMLGRQKYIQQSQ